MPPSRTRSLRGCSPAPRRAPTPSTRRRGARPRSPQPGATATPAAPLSPAEALGIREVDTAEALAAAGLTYVRYAPGEEVPWAPGLFLLDVESGEVEGWVRAITALSDEERRGAKHVSDDLGVSPSSRFLSWAAHGILHDRHTGRSYALDASRIEFDRWWGIRHGERILFRFVSSGALVVMDAELRPVARLELPPGERFTSPNGGYILVRECVGCDPGDRFHLVNLEDEANPEVHSWVLPWRTLTGESGDPPYRIELLDGLVAFVASSGDSTCRVVRHDLNGTLASDRTFPCWSPLLAWNGVVGLPRISPDGSLILAATSGHFVDSDSGVLPFVATIFDTVTGDAIVRVKSAYLPWFELAPVDIWLADNSGIVVNTNLGKRIVTIGGAWRPAPGQPSRTDADRFLSRHGEVTSRAGDVLAALSFVHPKEPITLPPGSYPILLERRYDWVATSGTLRVRTTILSQEHWVGGSGRPPLEPVIERPPFDDRSLVEVVVDTCHDIHKNPRWDAPIVACLPNGTVAEVDDFESSFTRNWLHIRTDDGLEGWAGVRYLRWHSDGVRLEE